MLLNIGYVIDNVLPQFESEKRVVFLAIIAVARIVVGRRERRDCVTAQTFLIVIWFCSYGISLGFKSDEIENAWIA